MLKQIKERGKKEEILNNISIY